MSTQVLLLRAPKDDEDTTSTLTERQDPYEATLKSTLGSSPGPDGKSDVGVTSVPVYETTHTLAELSWILETGPAFHGYGGIIATSRRAVQAWAAAARTVPVREDESRLEAGSEEEGVERSTKVAEDAASWSRIPFYVVGEATAAAVRALQSGGEGETPVPSRLAPGPILGGPETGTAEQLAHFIRRDVEARAAARLSASSSSLSIPLSPTDPLGTALLTSSSPGTTGMASPNSNSNSGSGPNNTQPPVPGRARGATLQRTPAKLLFLVGDKTRDVLPRVLAEGNPPQARASVGITGSSSSSNLPAQVGEGAGTGTVRIEVDAVQVYATRPSAGLGAALEVAVKAQTNVSTWWIVLFAPSGADAALPHLRQHFFLPSTDGSPNSSMTAVSPAPAPVEQKRKGSNSSKKSFRAKTNGPTATSSPPQLPAAKIAVIGPTTATHLRDVLKLEVAAIASKPNPEALANAIQTAASS